MKIKEKLLSLYDTVNQKFFAQFHFKIEDATFSNIVEYMHSPKDSSSLAVTRILFGLAMLFDIPDERGGAIMEKRWGNPKMCHFPLIPFIQPAPMPYMALVYAGLWFGALGMMLGYKYRYSVPVFTACYWYLFLAEKSYWNNHSYLFGLVALLLSFTEANCYWSIDVYLDPSKSKSEVPYWNYFILKYQFFILYFMAGLKKGTAEWLSGYSVQNLSEHWVFEPFKLFLTVPQTDYLIVHWFVFMFDLTVAIWMMCSSTRNVAMIFCAMFHLMNSRLFRIGMFPWVCLATMPLFYPFDWPKKLPGELKKIKSKICKRLSEMKTFGKQQNYEKSNDIDSLVDKDDSKVDDECNIMTDDDDIEDKEQRNKVCLDADDKVEKDIDYEDDQTDSATEESDDNTNKVVKKNKKENLELTGINSKMYKHEKKQIQTTLRQKITVCLVIFHVLSQAFLPFSHFITQGYNNWTNGLYGYSWDMMVHTWDTHAVIVQIVDNEKHTDFYLDPYIYTPNERWTRHGDMVHQYARCLKDILMEDARKFKFDGMLSENISVYVDVWCSLNGRFTQRIFDPKVDLLKVEWGPFQKVSYVMPLLDEALDWRLELENMKKEVHSWSNYSDVIFFADFPGYEQEKFISEDLRNVTLTILDGVVAYHPEVTNLLSGYSIQLTTGDHISVPSGLFHKLLNIGQKPAFYMYTFFNSTEVENDRNKSSKLPVMAELYIRFLRMFTFCNLMLQNLVCIFFSTC